MTSKSRNDYNIPESRYANKSDPCIICGSINIIQKCKLESLAGRKKNLTGLLSKYLGVKLDAGIICRYCQEKLLTIDNKTEALRSTCLSNLQTVANNHSHQSSANSPEPETHSTSPQGNQSKGLTAECMQDIDALDDSGRLALLNHLLQSVPSDDLLAIASSLFNAVYQYRGNNPSRNVPDDFLSLAITALLKLEKSNTCNLLYLLARALSSVQLTCEHLPLDSLPFCVIELILRSLFATGCEDFHNSSHGKVVADWITKSCGLTGDVPNYLSHLNSLLFPWHMHKYTTNVDAKTQQTCNQIVLEVNASYVDLQTEIDEKGLVNRKMGILVENIVQEIGVFQPDAFKESQGQDHMGKDLNQCSFDETNEITSDDDVSQEVTKKSKKKLGTSSRQNKKRITVQSNKHLSVPMQTRKQHKESKLVHIQPKPVSDHKSLRSLKPDIFSLGDWIPRETSLPAPKAKNSEKKIDWDNVKKIDLMKRHFICKKCTVKGPDKYLRFCTSAELEKHKLEKHGEQKDGSFKCGICGDSSMTSKEELANHVNVHKKTCKQCNYLVPAHITYRAHTRLHLKSKLPVPCQQCPSVFAARWDLRMHVFNHHDKEMPFACDECRRRFKTQGILDEHVKVQHENIRKSISCALCEETFNFKSALHQHMKSQHNLQGKDKKVRVQAARDIVVPKKQPPKIRCTHCIKTFTKRFEMFKHRATFHPQIFASAECPVCNKLYYGRACTRLMQQHYQKNHETSYGTEYPCKVCDKAFDIENLLRFHEKAMHPPVTDRSFACDRCPIKFKTAAARELHMAKHKKPLQYSCEFCSKSFALERNCARHIQMIHWGRKREEVVKAPAPEKVYMCATCGKELESSKALDIHKHRVHLGNPLYAYIKCNECDKMFACARSLRKHVTYIHRKKARLTKATCEICGKSFKYNLSYREHMLNIHKQGSTDFQCNMCHRFYTSDGHLQKHIRISHRNVSVGQATSDTGYTKIPLREITVVGKRAEQIEIEMLGQSADEQILSMVGEEEMAVEQITMEEAEQYQLEEFHHGSSQQVQLHQQPHQQLQVQQQQLPQQQLQQQLQQQPQQQQQSQQQFQQQQQPQPQQIQWVQPSQQLQQFTQAPQSMVDIQQLQSQIAKQNMLLSNSGRVHQVVQQHPQPRNVQYVIPANYTVVPQATPTRTVMMTASTTPAQQPAVASLYPPVVSPAAPVSSQLITTANTSLATALPAGLQYIKVGGKLIKIVRS